MFKNKLLALIFAVSIIFSFPSQANAANGFKIADDGSGNLTCVADSSNNPAFTSQNACQNRINQIVATGRVWYIRNGSCTFSTTLGTAITPNPGQYPTKSDCQSHLQNTKWKIQVGTVGNSTCVQDPNGSYNTFDDCQNALHPGKYKITTGSIGQKGCFPDANGPYNSFAECQAALEIMNSASPPPPKGSNPCGDPNNANTPVTGCDTALGNIPTDPSAFVGRVLTIAIGLAGGIALIIMVFGSIKILMSGGDPKNVAAGRELIVAAVSGLLFLILSVLILRFIGSTLLPTNPF